jgi:hypothetical protein
MGSRTRPLGRSLLRGGGEVRVDLGKYQVVCHRGRGSSPEDEAASSSPARPTETASDQRKRWSVVFRVSVGLDASPIRDEVGASVALCERHSPSDQQVRRFLGPLLDADFGRTAVVERITSRADRDAARSSSEWPTPREAWVGFARPDVTEPGAEGHHAMTGHGLSRPSRWAIAAASPRPVTPSLARILETWTLAVFGVMNSAWPICWLVRPSATSASTSASRGVRPSEAAGDDGAFGAAVVSTGSSRRRRPRWARSSISRRSGPGPSVTAVWCAPRRTCSARGRGVPPARRASAYRKRA